MRSAPLAANARALAAALAVTLVTATASAHPLLDRARARYDEADFQGALQHLASAESARDLSRDDLIALLSLRALVHLANEDQPALEADLVCLASIAPAFQFGRDAPPEAREALTRVRGRSPGPLELAVVAVAQPSGLSLEPDVRNDVGSIVREVRVHARVVGAARWESAVGAPLLIQAGAGQAVEHYAVAIGPGGAEVAARGSAAEPVRWLPTAGEADTAIAPGTSDGSGIPWLWIGGGLAVAAVAVVVIIFATSSSGDPNTQPSLPSVLSMMGPGS